MGRQRRWSQEDSRAAKARELTRGQLHGEMKILRAVVSPGRTMGTLLEV
jgi:hypothetical protein